MVAPSCREFGISRKTGYKIFERYKQDGAYALCDRSRRPVRYANQLPDQIERLIVATKREKQHWGARKIRELLLLRAFSSICQRIDPSLKWQQRGLPKLMLKNQQSLTSEQRGRLQAYFKKQAAIHQLYLFKEEAKHFLMTRNKSRKALQREGIVGFFMKLVEQMKTSGFDLFRTLGKTLQTWQEEILRMFVFPYSNGITEGFHRKMKLIQRRAYGFRNF